MITTVATPSDITVSGQYHPAIEAIFVSKGVYWVVIPERDIALVRDIAILFSQLDFHIVYRNGRDMNELVPIEAKEVMSKTPGLPEHFKISGFALASLKARKHAQR